MYGTHTLAFQRIFVRMKIIALIFIRFSYVSLIRNGVTGPLQKKRPKDAIYLQAGRRFSFVEGTMARLVLILLSHTSGQRIPGH